MRLPGLNRQSARGREQGATRFSASRPPWAPVKRETPAFPVDLSPGAGKRKRFPMILIDVKFEGHPDVEGLERDVVTMTWEERRKSRQRVTTAKGVEIAIGLPTGSVLEHGEIIYRDGERYIAVEAAEEEVLCIFSEDPSEAALAAYEIGNRHLPIAVSPQLLMTPFDPLLEIRFTRMGMRCERRCTPFEPARRGHAHA